MGGAAPRAAVRQAAPVTAGGGGARGWLALGRGSSTQRDARGSGAMRAPAGRFAFPRARRRSLTLPRAAPRVVLRDIEGSVAAVLVRANENRYLASLLPCNRGCLD
jgi:hypothetical protein